MSVPCTVKQCTGYTFAILLSLLPFLLLADGETVHLNNGKFQKGDLISSTDEALTFEFKRADNSQVSRVQIPWKSIERIEFTSSVKQIDAMANPDGTELKVFTELWAEASPWLNRPDSPAADIGILYAKKLATSDAEMSIEQAIDMLNLIIKDAWNPDHQSEAIRAKLEILLAAGKEREAIREAEALAEASENPAHLIEAKMTLAQNAFSKLKEIEEENPRWDIDDEVRPVRNAYFNDAIDHSLFAYLFHGSREEASARGLFLASQIYEYAEEYANSEICAQDILKLYPLTASAKQAKEQVSKLSKLTTP